MNSKLFISDKIKVGFNPRTDTYTGKLGYVIGHDGKKWRKEPSWEGWRYQYLTPEEFEAAKQIEFDQRLTSLKRYFQTIQDSFKSNNGGSNDYHLRFSKMSFEEYLSKECKFGDYENFVPDLYKKSGDKGMDVQEFENIPTEGFVLNKKAGGGSSNWNQRATYCRVYDPRGFEFEITIPNLLFILQECNAYKGKGLEGTFVYSWDGKDLVLLPTSSSDYRESQKFTELQSGKVSTKDLVEGCVYKTKRMDEYIYIGKYSWSTSYNGNTNTTKNYIFKDKVKNSYIPFPSLSDFVQKVTDSPISNFAEALNGFSNSINSVKLDISENDYFPPTTIYWYYRRKQSLGRAYLPLGDGKYEIVDIYASEISGGNGHSRDTKINTYNLISKKMLVLTSDGDFTIKAIKGNSHNNVSIGEIEKMNLKVLINNKTKINF